MPKFEKKNHHYVPQHWQRGFRGRDGNLYGKFRDGGIRLISPRTVMQQAYLYTVFDNQWNPSDSLEDALSTVEDEDAKLFQRLNDATYETTADDRKRLCAVLALQATRHPDILRRGARRGRELGELLARAHDYSLEEFLAQMNGFAVSENVAQNCYYLMRSRSEEQLATELADLMALSPQSSQFPEQEALRAIPLVDQRLQQMDLWLLDTPETEAVVLGDTPIPQSELYQGFSVPLSRSLAVLAVPAQVTQTLLARRNATVDEVGSINRSQSENALHVVIGPSAQLLSTL